MPEHHFIQLSIDAINTLLADRIAVQRMSQEALDILREEVARLTWQYQQRTLNPHLRLATA